MKPNSAFLLLFVILLSVNCSTENKEQTLTDVIKYSTESTLSSGFELKDYSQHYSVSLKAFLGLIELDTVIGFCIDTKCSEKCTSTESFSSDFTIEKIRIDFNDGTYSTLIPFQTEISSITENGLIYFLKKYYFKPKDLRLLDKKAKSITIIDIKRQREGLINLSSSQSEENIVLFNFMAYLIPLSIIQLRALPYVKCSFYYEGKMNTWPFPKVFPNMRSDLCGFNCFGGCQCD
jgi:hypothetical protein